MLKIFKLNRTLKIALVAIFLMSGFEVYSQSFYKYFSEGTLRVDFFFAGNHKKTEIFIDEMFKEPHWGGIKRLPAAKDPMGNIRYNVYDKTGGKLLYSKGMSTLFQEWQTTDEAKKISKTMSATALMPYPRARVVLEIEERSYETGLFVKIFSTEINPDDYFIRSGLSMPAETRKLLDNGAPENHVDIVFLAEGYTELEKNKFYDDVSRIYTAILAREPFNKYRNSFNIYAVAGVSQESGTDVPGKRIYRNTVLNSTFYTFDIDRYLTTFDSKNIYHLAANAPCDAIFILVNSNMYGGGGFYNWYAIGTADNYMAEQVAAHEFGHSFAGLADEYYTSSTPYNDFYNLKVEPWEPNISTLVDFKQKWKNMLKPEVPVPTPRDMKYFDELGVFEGGGYVSKGVFSPKQDCMMNTGRAEFCPVCSRAIVKKIKELKERN